MDEFRVGRARVTRVEEWAGVFLTPERLFAGFTPEHYAATRDRVGAEYLHADGSIEARLQTWVIELDGRTIVVDTGAGNDKVRPGIPVFGGLRTPFLDRLAAAGHRAEAVDFVVCTHLHVDHVGWNTRLEGGAWVPTFPNARYVFPAPDVEYWDPRNAARFPAMVGAAVNEGFYDDSVRPILERGLATTFGGRTELLPGLTLLPAPGHTPGSTVIELRSDGDVALFAGDVIHHPLQILNPEWNSIFCEDAGAARASRRRVLELATAENALLIPAHFAGRHCARIEREADRFVPVWPGA